MANFTGNQHMGSPASPPVDQDNISCILVRAVREGMAWRMSHVPRSKYTKHELLETKRKISATLSPLVASDLLVLIAIKIVQPHVPMIFQRFAQ